MLLIGTRFNVSNMFTPTERPPFTWGHLCLENCAVKCQTDCIDRVTGECPPLPTDYTMLFVLLTWPLTIIPVTCISYLIVCFHRSLVVELEEEYDEILLQ
ncbi:uncharacterized protein LOC129923891 isoform X2 [Biomphalaria glabrata]|uniref:Uncharacterized protein LOC129923891 isoform X2 n=1 Tax=Biomphalaria glabrata TaxID=6526 RepID=A0A9W2ZCC7_BIOGL|nr:uncharacterized protein LOC129923891 isoform X2 [Biomphalaria glabrata]